MPEQSNENQPERIDPFAIALKALNIGLSRANIKGLELEIRRETAAKIEEKLRERGLNTEAEFEVAAQEIVKQYIDGAKPAEQEKTGEPEQRPQQSEGWLEDMVSEEEKGKKTNLADAAGQAIDLVGISRSVMDEHLRNGDYNIGQDAMEILLSDVYGLVQTHKFQDAKQARGLIEKEISYALEPYKTRKKPVEQPELRVPEKVAPKQPKAREDSNELSRKASKFLTPVVASLALATAFAGGAIITNYLKNNHQKPETVYVASGSLENTVSDGLRQIIETNKRTLEILDRHNQTPRDKEIKQSVEYSSKETQKAVAEQGDRIVSATTSQEDKITKAIAEQGDKTVQAIRQGYDKIIESNQSLERTIIESRKEDPEPIAPEPQPSQAELDAQKLIDELNRENAAQKPAKTPNPYRLTATPYIGIKYAFESEQKPDSMPVFGLELGLEKDGSPFSGYLAAEYGEMTSSESSSLGSLDLKSKATTLRLGGKLSSSKEKRLRGNVSAGLRVTMEENDIAGRVGSYTVDDSRKETILGFEAGAGLEWRLTDYLSLSASAIYEQDFEDDNSNVTKGGKAQIGLTVRF